MNKFVPNRQLLNTYASVSLFALFAGLACAANYYAPGAWYVPYLAVIAGVSLAAAAVYALIGG